MEGHGCDLEKKTDCRREQRNDQHRRCVALVSGHFPAHTLRNLGQVGTAGEAIK